ncbi:hypothetical protein [Emcibacter sp.]|uniref:hypothetical protein n=1 Tax=Emcibacter sp. TaxID=1979954 RepID=UPI003A94BA63
MKRLNFVFSLLVLVLTAALSLNGVSPYSSSLELKDAIHPAKPVNHPLFERHNSTNAVVRHQYGNKIVDTSIAEWNGDFCGNVALASVYSLTLPGNITTKSGASRRFEKSSVQEAFQPRAPPVSNVEYS